jgi:exopolysaccharide biosynthesis protein
MNNYSGTRAGGGRNGGYFETHGRNVPHNKRDYSRVPEKRKLPVWLVIIIDVLLTALLLCIFYVTNYEMHSEVKPVASLPVPSWLASAPPGLATENPASPSAATETVQTVTADPNDWRAKFPDKFTDGSVEKTETSYKSANINISVQAVQKFDVTCYIADIYVAELKYFKTAFAKKPDVMGNVELTSTVAKENEAILAINGDHCVDGDGTVVRNGQLYRKPKSSLDVLVMNYDGSMQTFSPDEFDVDKTLSGGVYQVWTFGPELLKDGQPMTDFNSTVKGLNPRTAVGYYEPGHYCFVVVGGRQKGFDEGCTMQQLSQLFSELGCKTAYNLDGGRSSEMIYLGNMLNEQASGRRTTPDILYIADK